MKETAILVFSTGEFFWEYFRIVPYVVYLKMKKYKNSKFVVLTREERFDLYGKIADILVPLRIPGDYEKYWPNCHRLMGLSDIKYKEIQKLFYSAYKNRFNIVKKIFPDVSKRQFCNKYQFPRNQMIYEWFPRERNYELVNDYLPTDKPIIIISPRYRGDLKRNWAYWRTFFDMVADDNYLMDHFNFILCGKGGEYIPDDKKRFFDLNDIQLDENSSLAGLLLATMSKSYFTFGSQSAIPNISLLCGVEAMSFGNQRKLHTVTYNVKKTPVTFVDDYKFEIEPKAIFDKFRKRLQQKEKGR